MSRPLEAAVHAPRRDVATGSAVSEKVAATVAQSQVAGVQLRLEDAVQGNGVMGVDGDDRISVTVVMRRVQDVLGGRKDPPRALELEHVGVGVEVRHRGMADDRRS